MKIWIIVVLFVALSFCQSECQYGPPVFVKYTPNALRHGIEGPGVNPADQTHVYIGSDVGQYIAKVGVSDGSISTFIPQPLGESDDMIWAKDGSGTVVYCSLLTGVVRSRNAAGIIKTIATVPPIGPNGVSESNDGKYYFTQNPVGTGLWEVDPTGIEPQKLILNLSSPMNGFDFGLDNEVYGPLNEAQTVVRVNLQTKTETVIASGFIDPESVRWNPSKTKLYALDDGYNAIYEINPQTGAKTLVTSVPEPAYVDNFQFFQNTIIMAETVHNSVIQYDLGSKTTRLVTPYSDFCLPMGISYVASTGTLYIADYACLKRYSPLSNQLVTYARGGPQPPPDPNIQYGMFNIYATPQYVSISCNFGGVVQIRQTASNAYVTSVPSGWPYGTVISADYSTLLVNDYGTGLTVWNGTEFQQETLLYPLFPYNNLTGMAPAQQAYNIYVAEYNHGSIFKVNYQTGRYSVVATGLTHPEGLVRADENGVEKLIVACVGTQSLVKITVSSGQKTTIATNLPIGLAGAVTLPPPNTLTGVAVGPNGNVYVTSDIDDALIEIPVV